MCLYIIITIMLWLLSIQLSHTKTLNSGRLHSQTKAHATLSDNGQDYTLRYCTAYTSILWSNLHSQMVIQHTISDNDPTYILIHWSYIMSSTLIQWSTMHSHTLLMLVYKSGNSYLSQDDVKKVVVFHMCTCIIQIHFYENNFKLCLKCQWLWSQWMPLFE